MSDDNVTREPVSIRALIADASVANPGDVVVLSFSAVLSAAQRESVRRAVDEIGGEHGIKFLLLVGGVQVTVARKNEGPEA